MIKNGRYKFLKFEKNKEKFIDAFVEYYGKENEEVIRQRFDTITYVPYMNYNYVLLYYSKLIGQHADEIIDKYCELSGRKNLTPEMRDMIMNSDGRSEFFLAVNEGEGLDEVDFIGDIQGIILQARKNIAKAFKMKKEDPYKEIKREARHITHAVKDIEYKYNNPVFADVRRAIDNRNTAMQMYLSYVNKHAVPLLDKDIELLSKPNFDSYDRENLSCKHFLFGSNIENPGLVSYFSTEAEYKAKQSIDDYLDIIGGRVLYIALQDKKDKLKFVTYDEIIADIGQIEDKQEYAERLAKEYQNMLLVAPEYFVPTKIADLVEMSRKSYVYNLYAGCRFASKLNSSYADSTHTVDSNEQWLTHLEFDGYVPDKPHNVIFFDETAETDPERLQDNLIHELNHAIGHGKAIVDKDGKYAYSSSGIIGFVRTMQDGQYLGDYIAENKGINQIGEDWNERMSMEIAKIFKEKYGCVYEDGDINIRPDDYKGWQCAYDYYNFMTKKFWDRYKDDIKQARLNDSTTIFYDHDKRPPFGKREVAMNNLKYKYLMTMNPDKLASRGKINYDILNKLGVLVMDFKNFLENECYGLELTPQSLISGDYMNSEKIPDDIKNKLYAYQKVSDNIYDEMVAEENKINANREVHKNIRNAPKKAIEKVKEKGVEVVDFIRGRKQKSNDESSKKSAHSTMIESDKTLQSKDQKNIDQSQIVDDKDENSNEL